MREIVVMLICCAVVCVCATVIFMRRHITAAKKKDKTFREVIMDGIANSEDMIVFIYKSRGKNVEFVSDSVSWLFGFSKKRIQSDIKYLFVQFGISCEDEFIHNFLSGNVLLAVQKEFYYYNSLQDQNRWITFKAIPCGPGRTLLMGMDTTENHETARTLLVAINAIDGVKRAQRRLLSILEQDGVIGREGKSVFEPPEIDLEDDIEDEEEQLEQRKYNGKHILVVEDNNSNTEFVRELLLDSGAVIDTAANGEEAVEMFRNSSEGYYDLMFMDIQMPVMDGYEATRQIRALERMDAKVIPIVAMTTYIFKEDVRGSFQAGMDMHIVKPLSTKKLSGIMRKYLAK